ncbi:MAG: metal ABC transporter permease [Candidatus Magnetoovum sp. WYHC-5]|nr:metal ABC transporter permease [Candidatus Magnetoovum sp. WYHC-5]
MTTPQVEVLLIAVMVAACCSLPGVFLVLRGEAMATDAISHSILFGIVIAFLIVKDISSPFLLVGAALTGVLMVAIVEIITNTKLVREDASIGLVFPFLFSVGVILIAKKIGNVHIDTDAVLLGEIAFAPFDRLVIYGYDLGPKALYVLSGIFILNVLFITIFYKELKLSTFDPGLSTTLGFPSKVIHYCLMAIASLTAVGAFDAVGVVLVVALMIVPAAASYLLVEKLYLMIVVSLIIALVSSVSGFFIATQMDISIAGTISVTAGLCFVGIFFFAPRRGIIFLIAKKTRQKLDFAHLMLLVHISNHEKLQERYNENNVREIYKHLNWERIYTSTVIHMAINRGTVVDNKGVLSLSNKGKQHVIETIMK